MKTRLFAFAALGIALTACTNDNEVTDNDPVAAVINAEISDAVATRASGTAWAERDEIGISESRFGYANVLYRWENGKFTPAGTIIFFQDDDPTTFSAYYPYDADGGTLTATTDATAQQNQPAIDFLYATGATASTHNPEVNFTDDTDAGGTDCSFHHCMSQITLTFEAGSGVSFTAIKPVSYTLSGLTLTGSFDTETGIAKADEDAQTANLTMGLGGELTSSVILFPQTRASIGLTVVYNDNEYNATLSVPDGALKSGNNYTWTVSVRNKDLSIGSAEISDWNPVSGGIVDADL
ncbi:fimbrillin family protein [Phocaeicola barnesiae]|uniref:fimbrillin family protein n=1 Tax=Phocaeicola barnesiae TaxID=376804 RepID=UPI001F319C7F|nr:fimbrillin family protein [Phocaeicola barnesiae]MCF2575956.1 fimbrillin family protein [Phocaeicola barnesiae]MDM8253322.1 fimbrillin family protein [Phocaeicola barnesiae]